MDKQKFNIVVAISTLSALVTIYVFVTGRETLLPAESDQPVQTLVSVQDESVRDPVGHSRSLPEAGEESPEQREPGVITGPVKTPWLGLELHQGSTAVPFELVSSAGRTRHVARYRLRPEPFQILVPRSAPMPVGIIAWREPEIFDVAEETEGCYADRFEGGTGMAAFRFSTATLMLDRCGMNYFVGERLEEVGDQYWGISVARLDDLETPGSGDIRIEDWNRPLYLAIWRDLDPDDPSAPSEELVDHDEVERLILEFG